MLRSREGWAPTQTAWISTESGRTANIVMRLGGDSRTAFVLPEVLEPVLDLALSRAKPGSVGAYPTRIRREEEDGIRVAASLTFSDASTEHDFRTAVYYGAREYMNVLSTTFSPAAALEAARLKMDREAEALDRLNRLVAELA
jgi:hypothetical protein